MIVAGHVRVSSSKMLCGFVIDRYVSIPRYHGLSCADCIRALPSKSLILETLDLAEELICSGLTPGAVFLHACDRTFGPGPLLDMTFRLLMHLEGRLGLPRHPIDADNRLASITRLRSAIRGYPDILFAHLSSSD
jgi:hypothetical protein